MKYSNQTLKIHSLNIYVKQVNKTTARKLYNSGITVYLHPCNMTINNPWQPPMAANIANEVETSVNTFDYLVNSWGWYNANSEMGLYPNFFITC
jgi:hypothetical protein